MSGIRKSRPVIEIYEDTRYWAQCASDAGKDEMSRLAFEAANLLLEAASLYHDMERS